MASKGYITTYYIHDDKLGLIGRVGWGGHANKISHIIDWPGHSTDGHSQTTL